MGFICLTNNYSLYEKYKNEFEIQFYDVGLRDIFIKARDMAHIGYKILTHPLSGSVKPNETTIKTVFMSDKPYAFDYESVMLIENSIATLDKLAKKTITYENNRADFECVDLSLAESALSGLFVSKYN